MPGLSTKKIKHNKKSEISPRGGPPTPSPTPLFKKKYIPLNEAAVYLGIKNSTLRKWVQKKTIPFYRFPCPTSHPRFNIDDLERYTNQHRIEGRVGKI